MFSKAAQNLAPAAKAPRLFPQQHQANAPAIVKPGTPAPMEEKIPDSTMKQLPMQDETQTTEGATSKRPRAPTHPKGHRVINLPELYASIDKSDFLKYTDSYQMQDMWYQPKCIDMEGKMGLWVTSTFFEMIAAPNIKTREITVKSSCDDILKMCYLADKIRAEAIAHPTVNFDTWYSIKVAAYIKASGDVENAQVQAVVANFILTADPDFTFDLPNSCNVSIFFRKMGYHSYSTGVKGEKKVVNPNVLKSKSPKGKMDHVIEARLFLKPVEWRDAEVAITSVEA